MSLQYQCGELCSAKSKKHFNGRFFKLKRTFRFDFFFNIIFFAFHLWAQIVYFILFSVQSFSWKHDVISLEYLLGWQAIGRTIQDWKINFKFGAFHI